MTKKRTVYFAVFLIFMMMIVMQGCSETRTESAKDYSKYKEAEDLQFLQMKSGKDFNIMFLTDMHMNSQSSCDFLTGIAKALIDAHNPDIVMMLGDNIDNAKEHLQYLERFIDKLEEWKQPWGIIMGNHDRDPQTFGLEAQNDMLVARDDVYGMYRKGSLDWKDYHPEQERDHWLNAKLGNYTIAIRDGEEIIYSMVMMDSGQHLKPGSDKNGYIEGYQVDWYKNHVKELSEVQYGEFDMENGKYVPSMVFIHQPVPEYVEAAMQGISMICIGEVKAHKGFGFNSENPYQKVQRDDVNFGLFEAMQQYGGTHMFAGHNHGNNSSIKYGGVWLSYANRTGRRGNEGAPQWNDNRINYAKMITIKSGSYETDMNFVYPDGTVSKKGRLE